VPWLIIQHQLIQHDHPPIFPQQIQHVPLLCTNKILAATAHIVSLAVFQAPPCCLFSSCQASQLTSAGQQPYAYRFERTHYTADLQQQYADLAPGGELPEVAVAVAGRVVGRRVMGKLAFMSLRDDKGAIQVGGGGGAGAGRGGRWGGGG
jgi:hypothetical protein